MQDIFTREHISNFSLSLSDNRQVKFSLLKLNELIDIKIVFESVHKKHQFAELLNIDASEENNVRDLKMFNLTWNFG